MLGGGLFGSTPPAPAFAPGFAPALPATAAGDSCDGDGTAQKLASLSSTAADELLAGARITARRGGGGDGGGHCLVTHDFFGASAPRAVWVEASYASGLPEAPCVADMADAAGGADSLGSDSDGTGCVVGASRTLLKEERGDSEYAAAAFVTMLLDDAPPTATLLRALLTSLEDGEWCPRGDATLQVPTAGHCMTRRSPKAETATLRAVVSALYTTLTARAGGGTAVADGGAAADATTAAAGAAEGTAEGAAEWTRLASALLVRLSTRPGAYAVVLQRCLGPVLFGAGEAVAANCGSSEAAAPSAALPAIAAALTAACPALGEAAKEELRLAVGEDSATSAEELQYAERAKKAREAKCALEKEASTCALPIDTLSKGSAVVTVMRGRGVAFFLLVRGKHWQHRPRDQRVRVRVVAGK